MKLPVAFLSGALSLVSLTSPVLFGVPSAAPGSANPSPSSPPAPPADAPYRNPGLSVDRRVEDLLARMTLEEKIGQVTQLDCGKNTNANNVNLKIGESKTPTHLVGSFLTYANATESRKRLQKFVVEGSRLGIPAIFGADVIHGHRTCFPQPIAQASTFNPDLIRRACSAVAREAKGSGIDWTFAPLCDVARDPRWGRLVETFGEDQYLVGRMAAASVRGYQDPVLGSKFGIAACLKHYVGYGASESGVDYAATEISEQTMQDVYLPPFRDAINAGAMTIMSGFNNVNGIPLTGNRYLVTDVLRGQLGFRGFVVSDFNGPLQLGPEFSAMAASESESARLALHAGVDLDMMDGIYPKHLPELIANGSTPIAELDEAVRRILRVKFECGLFENPYTPEVPADKLYLQQDTLDLARQVAAESFVLLKNDKGILPLSKSNPSIALVGPFADKNWGLNGSWSGFSRNSESIGIREALTATLMGRGKVNFIKGCDGFTGKVDKDGLQRVAAESDVIVLCIGDDRNGENVSRCSLDLPWVQSQLVDEAVKTGKPVVLLVLSGKPIIINKAVEKCAAVMLIWQGGTQAGPAVADVLTGATSPSGRLSFSWPRHQGQIPIYYSKRRTNRPYSKSNPWTSRYQDESLDPLYPFGYGLSYSKFEYSPITLSGANLKGANRLVAEVTVTNKGSRAAQETVLWYLSPSHGSITRPVKLLKNFEKRMLAPGESGVFRFEIDPARDLSYPDARGRMILEAAEYTLNINDATIGNASGVAKFDYKP